MSTTQVASYSILAIPLLVVCLTLVWWPTIVTANLSINLTAKRITPRCCKKKKDSRQKEKPHGKISSIPRGHFNSYFFCREVMVILFAVRLILKFAVTIVGHHTKVRQTTSSGIARILYEAT